MTSLAGALPPSPNHRRYRELLAEIANLFEHDPQEAMIHFRAQAEIDFWFFCRYVSQLGQYRISDPAHPRRGKMWLDEQWLFDRCREIQVNLEERRNMVLYYWFRYALKSTLIIKCGSMWLLARDPSETIAIFTYKLEQSGESIGGDILDEIKTNEDLKRYWPQFRNLQEKTDTRITLDRPPGPREPSVAVLPITGAATGSHPSWIWFDDAVTEYVVDSEERVRKVDLQIVRTVALCKENTPMQFVGTPWGENDPVYKRYKAGVFRQVSFQPAFVDGKPQLRTKSFFDELRRNMRSATAGIDTYTWSCQYMLKPEAKGNRFFLDSWRKTYAQPPALAARGCRIHVILDPAGGGKDSDFTSIRVIGHRFDRKRLNLDLWRERVGLTDTEDLLFGMEPEERKLAENAWKPALGIIQQWQPIDPEITLWVEDYGNSTWLAALRSAAARAVKAKRIAKLSIRALPKLSRKKESRIKLLQPYYRGGLILDPHHETGELGQWLSGGFGHGSRDDQRDTLQQYLEDEWTLFTLDGEGTSHDDCLDTDAWPVQPECAMAWPAQAPAPNGSWNSWPHSTTGQNGTSWRNAGWGAI